MTTKQAPGEPNLEPDWHDAHDQVAFLHDALELCALAGPDHDIEAAALAGQVAPLLPVWNDLDLQQRRARLHAGRAQALVRRRHALAVGVIARLHEAVLEAAGHDRQTRLYRHFFPHPLTVLLRQRLDGLLPELRTLHEALLGEGSPETLRTGLLADVAQMIAWAEAALQERAQAQAEGEPVAAAVDAWRKKAQTTLHLVWEVLHGLAERRHLEPYWVDGFFRESDIRQLALPTPSPVQAPAPDGTSQPFVLEPHAPMAVS